MRPEHLNYMTQLKGIARNLNQLTRSANAGGFAAVIVSHAAIITDRGLSKTVCAMIGKIITGSSFGATVSYVMKEQSRILGFEGIEPPGVQDMYAISKTRRY